MSSRALKVWAWEGCEKLIDQSYLDDKVHLVNRASNRDTLLIVGDRSTLSYLTLVPSL